MAAPERFAETSYSLLHRGRRPYMAHHGHLDRGPTCPLLELKRSSEICASGEISQSLWRRCIRSYSQPLQNILLRT